MMISTSCYKYVKDKTYGICSISGDRGKGEQYVGKCYPSLAPKLSFWTIWHNNIGKISEQENNQYYIEQFYHEVLSKLDPQKVYNELDNFILLCYEEGTEFCHRHIVAEWFEILLGVEVPEIKIVNGKIERVKRPEYIREYLIHAMKSNKNMRGFTSLRALYLFEQSEQLGDYARTLGESHPNYCDYMQYACWLRCDADEIESEYKDQEKTKIK